MEKKRVYKKNSKITIVTEEEYRENGKPINKEKILAKDIWSYYRHLSAKEYTKFNQIKGTYNIESLFIINWRPGIKSGMKIYYKGDLYRIESIDDYEGKRCDLKIYASRYDIQETKR